MPKASTCPCGAELPPMKYQGNPRKWCSEACRTRAAYVLAKERGTAHYRRCAIHVSTCGICGRLWSGKRGNQPPQSCPLRECRKASHAKRMRDRYAQNPDTGRARVAAFRAQMTPEQVAAEAARKRAWVESKGGRSVVGKDSDHARRARIYGVDSERFDPREVFERDGWVCGICDEPIDQALRYPDPMSVSLDHTVPLSLGGPHSRANTRPAHYSCNVRRGNRVEPSLSA